MHPTRIGPFFRVVTLQNQLIERQMIPYPFSQIVIGHAGHFNVASLAFGVLAFTYPIGPLLFQGPAPIPGSGTRC